MTFQETVFKELIELFECKCMTEFEWSFVADMKTRYENKQSFTIKQLRTIHRIYQDRIA